MIGWKTHWILLFDATSIGSLDHTFDGKTSQSANPPPSPHRGAQHVLHAVDVGSFDAEASQPLSGSQAPRAKADHERRAPGAHRRVAVERGDGGDTQRVR